MQKTTAKKQISKLKTMIFQKSNIFILYSKVYVTVISTNKAL